MYGLVLSFLVTRDEAYLEIISFIIIAGDLNMLHPAQSTDTDADDDYDYI